MNKSWQTKDFILAAVLSVVFSMLFAISGIATAILGGVTHAFAPAISGFFGASIYLLMLVKVPKFGIFTLSSFIIIIVMFITGHTFLPLLLSILFGAIIADLICFPSKYKSFWALASGFTFFMIFQALGVILPIMFFLEDYQEYVIEKKSERGVKSSMAIVDFMNIENALLLIGLTAIASIIGFLLGKKLLHKHFEKAGKLN